MFVSQATWDHHLAWLWAQVAQAALIQLMDDVSYFLNARTLDEVMLQVPC